MSQEYANAVAAAEGKKPNMRDFLKRPGKRNKDGSIQYFTEQSHTSKCDIMNIIKQYDRTGVFNHVAKIEAKFGDMTGADYKTMADKVIAAKNDFDALPSNIRKEFNNSPAELLKFMENPENRDKGIELGLINPAWTEGTDGLGEHVPEGGQKTTNINDETKPPETAQ